MDMYNNPILNNVVDNWEMSLSLFLSIILIVYILNNKYSK
jgi:hypothetical protein